MTKLMMLSKMVNISHYGEKPTNEEIEILLKSLKPGKKWPLLIDYPYTEHYPGQLIAENYLDGLLEPHAGVRGG